MQYGAVTLFNGCPSFFKEFNNRLVSTDAGRTIAKDHQILLKQTEEGKHFVKEIQGAASKWRLADSVTGLSFSDGSSVSDGLAQSYSAQARVSLSVVAFEAFSRVFQDGKWLYAKSVVISANDPNLCSEARDFLASDGVFEKLHDRSAPPQQRRLNEFFNDRNDHELYSLCVGIRNAFSHGAIGGKPDLIELAPKLQKFVLGSIEDYCTNLGV